MNQFTITWKAPEFEYHPKGIHWYWTSIVLAVLFMAIAIYQQNFLFSVFIVIAEILLLIWGTREPRDINFALTEKGLVIEHHGSFPVRDFTHFSSFEDWSQDWSTIILELRGQFRHSMRLHVPRGRFAEIEHHFKQVIPQIHRDESLMEVMERFLGF